MRNKAKFFLSVAVALGCGCFALTGCVDNDYDLDDVDYVIGNNVDLRLPECSTDSILLRNIMELEEDGVVELVSDGAGDSIYCVRQSGKADIDPVHVADIKIAKPQIGDISATVSLRRLQRNTAPRKRYITIAVPGMGNVTVDDFEYYYDIKAEEAINQIEEKAATNINEDVVKIESVTIKENVATLRMKVEGLDFVDYMRLANLRLGLPRGLQVGRCTFRGSEIPASQIVGDTIRLTEGEIRVSTEETLVLTMTFEGITEGQDFTFDAASHTATIAGGFAVKGSFGIKSEDFDTQKVAAKIQSLSTEDQTYTVTNRTLDRIMPESITFNGNANFSRDIEIESFTGALKHKVETIEPIKLDDLPDFLNDDDVVLDLENPVLFIKAKSPIPAETKTSITVRNSRNNVGLSALDVVIHGNNTQNIFYLADAPTTYLPDGYEGAQWIQPVGGKIRDLIRNIPKQIDVTVELDTLFATNLSVQDSYDIDVEYEVYAPLSFGEDFLLVYRDSEMGWANDLDNMENVDFGYFEITTEATSNLPTKASLELVPVDSFGVRIPQLTVNKVEVPANANGHKVTFVIRPANGYTVNDVLNGNPTKGVQQLDGVQYVARLEGGAGGGALKGSSYMLLKKIQVTIKGGIRYDAN